MIDMNPWPQRLLWWMGVTYSPSRRLFDGHGYSRLGCLWRRRRYISTQQAMREQGRAMADAFAAGMASASPVQCRDSDTTPTVIESSRARR